MPERKVWIPTQTDCQVYDDIKLRALRMRKQLTLAEKVLRNRLRNRQLKGYKFRRQHPVDRFIVDFYCREAGLEIEVDGSDHDSREATEYDEARQKFLEQRGLTVMRFHNAQVVNDTNKVLASILALLEGLENVSN